MNGATQAWLYTSASGEREVLRVRTGAVYGLFRAGGKEQTPSRESVIRYVDDEGNVLGYERKP
jgi:hypothetical protein